MKIIKFRVWDKIYKKLCEWPIDINFYLSEKSGKVLDGFELDQFTGMKDKNGKEIFEGDILKKKETFWVGKICDKNKRECSFGVVTYSEDNATFLVGGLLFNRDMNRIGKDFEIVGNIHQNSELLK